MIEYINNVQTDNSQEDELRVQKMLKAKKPKKIPKKYDPIYIKYIIQYFGGWQRRTTGRYNTIIRSFLSLYYKHCGYNNTDIAYELMCDVTTVRDRLKTIHTDYHVNKIKDIVNFLDLHPELKETLDCYVDELKRKQEKRLKKNES
jgi:DNA-binding NarL/FixJ family response regulator